MFSLNFFGGFRRQRLALAGASDFAELPLHSSVQKQLDRITSAAEEKSTRFEKGNIWRSSINAVRPLLVRSITANIAIAGCVLGGVLASKAVIDRAASLSLALTLAVGFLLSEICKNLLQYWELKRRVQIARGIQLHLFGLINIKLLDIEPRSQEALSTGNLKTLVGSDVEAVEDFITAAAANWLPIVVLILVLTPTIYLMAGKLGLLGISVALVQIPIAVCFSRVIERYQDRTQRHQDTLTTLVGEWVKNIRLIRYLGWQPAISSQIEGQVRQMTVDSVLKHLMVCITYGISYSWWMVPLVVMLLGASVLNIPLELSSFFSSIWALSHLTNHIQNIPYSFTLFGAAIAGTRRISALLGAPELSRHLSPAPDESAPDGTPQRLRLTEVKVQFGETVALDIPELEINLGERTAIVGKVGSGKSLLLELITGERAPSAGQILIEGDSGRWRRLWEQHTYQWFRNQIAYTAQIPFLSNTTLRRNIDLGDDLTLAEVNDAALAAQLNPDISQLTHGVEEEVGETGVNLSGGQKQRVSLARAFASQRSFFILDDPLSSVDRHTEQELMEILCTPGRGIVLVSHRLAELSRCNRVLVLEDGRLIEDGPPELLLSQPRSAFKEFIEAAQTIEQMGEQK